MIKMNEVLFTLSNFNENDEKRTSQVQNYQNMLKDLNLVLQQFHSIFYYFSINKDRTNPE